MRAEGLTPDGNNPDNYFFQPVSKKLSTEDPVGN